MRIRLAEERDVAPVNDIVNHYIAASTAILDLEPVSLERRRNWFAAHTGIHPLLVGEEGGEIVVWSSLSPLYEKAGYRNAAELSLYVRHGRQGRGAGRRMMAAILDLGREQGVLTTVVSKITAGNAASDALHREFGFAKVGTLRDIARKFGAFVDVDIFQLFL